MTEPQILPHHKILMVLLEIMSVHELVTANSLLILPVGGSASNSFSVIIFRHFPPEEFIEPLSW
jgi:hypothetical protein